MAKIVLKNVLKVFNGSEKGSSITALENVNFEVDDGEFVTIVGPSGCGKSSLLYLIAGLDNPTSGLIEVDGKKVEGSRKEVGFIFQEVDRTLFPWLTVLRNVALGLEFRGHPKVEREDIARKYINLVGLEGFEESYPYQLSTGMKQKVALARVLTLNPEIILMDEPFASLDAQTRLIFQRELSGLWSDMKKTVIFVTHDIEESIFLGSRVLVMTPRPGTIHESHVVDFSYPREHALRVSPEFVSLKSKIFNSLQAMRQGSSKNEWANSQIDGRARHG